MIEPTAELRRRDFTVGIVTGGGTEFVRAVSEDLYGVPPYVVVGTLIDYALARDEHRRPVLRRIGSILGHATRVSRKS